MITQSQLREAVRIYEAKRQLDKREQQTRRARASFRREYQKIFRKQGRLFLKELAKLKPLFPRITEANNAAVGDVVPLLNLVFDLTSGEAIEATETAMLAGFEAGATNLLQMVAASNYSFELAFPQAEQYIAQNGALRVSQIDDTTRKVVRDIVTRAVQNGTAWNEVATQLIDQFEHFAHRPSYVVSWLNNRAELIAVTEIGNAYEQGSATMARRLTSAGLDMEKRWYGARDNRTSADCLSNMDAGWIPIADNFPSGVMQPLNHPGCRHTALYRRIKQ